MWKAQTTRLATRLRAIRPALPGYQRSWGRADLIAATTLLVIVIPEQLATSKLAGMPPITGYYAFIAGGVMFAVLGSNRWMSVGADSTIAPLFAAGVAQLAPLGSARYPELVGILALMVGILVVAVGALRLGWIAELLSAPIITGFLGGVAVIIVVHQLPDLLGLPGPSGALAPRVVSIAEHLGHTNGWALGIGVCVGACIIVAERVGGGRFPGALLGLVGSTLAVAFIGLRSHGVAVLGNFAHGFPSVGVSGVSWSALEHLAPTAGVVALVVLIQSAATSRAFAGESLHGPDQGRDFIGVGAGSIAAGLLGSFPVDASPPRTAAVAGAHGRTRMAGFMAAIALIVLLPAAGLLADVPVATLAAVLMVVAGRLLHIQDFVRIARFDKFEFALAVVTLLAVALIGVQQGILVAVGLAVLDRTRLTARPRLHVLGRIPGTSSWAPLGTAQVAEVPGIRVVLFSTPLWYANAAHFQTELIAALTGAPQPITTVVIDTIGMTDIDYTGCAALRTVLDDLDGRHITVAVARAGGHLQASLRLSGLEQRIGLDRFYPSVGEAVDALAAHP